MFRIKVRNHCKYCKIISQYYLGSNAGIISSMINDKLLLYCQSRFKTLGQMLTRKLKNDRTITKSHFHVENQQSNRERVIKTEWYREFRIFQNIRIDNRFFGKVQEFKYLGTTLTNQNSIQEEIKSRLKSGNACCYSVQNLLSSRLLSRNLKIKVYRTIILPVGLYGVKVGR